MGDGDTVTVTKDLGLVTQVFNESALAALRGEVAVGHCRYSTSGGMGNWTSAQPHMSAIDEVLIALAISALTNPLADMARAQLGTLRGCDAHFSVIISEEDIKLYKRLGIHVSCEPKYESKRLYHK